MLIIKLGMPCLLLLLSIGLLEARLWKSGDGKVFEGDLIKHDGSNVKIRRSDGKTFEFKRTLLSDKDNQFLDELDKRERMEAFITKYSMSYKDALKLKGIKKSVPLYVIYQNKVSVEDFKKAVYKYLVDSGFEELIEKRVVFALISEPDVDIEKVKGKDIDEFPQASMNIINKSGYIYSASNFFGGYVPDRSVDEFLKEVDEQLKYYENKGHLSNKDPFAR